jgi:hypothetical protein
MMYSTGSQNGLSRKWFRETIRGGNCKAVAVDDTKRSTNALDSGAISWLFLN